MPRRKGRAALAVAAALLAAIPRLAGQRTPPPVTPASVLAEMERVADWQLANPSTHPETDWTQAAGDAGFMALAGISGNARYGGAMLAVGARNGWKPGPRLYHADDHCIGQTYAELYLLYRDPRMISGLKERFDAILATPSAVKSLDFSQPGGQATELWSWCDSLFMGPPAWMRLYGATGDARYMDFAVRNWWTTSDYLYDRDECLFFRDSSYFRRTEANGRKVFWSRGNGWVMAGLVRVLQFLPRNHPDRPRFERQFSDMAARILSCQQADGLWRASLLDPASYPRRETSGSGFFAYALAWGVNQGILDPGKYGPAATRAWEALAACVDPDGKLAHVQPIGADPKRFSEDSTEVYGVGAFLLAGSEVYRLCVLEGMASAGAHAMVAVGNPAGFHREEETVEVDPAPLGFKGGIAVMDGVSSRILDSQAYASEPGRTPDRLLFQVDLAPRETRLFYMLDAGALAAVPQPPVKTYVRQIAERYNDIAWESDRIAHRMYSQDLIRGEGTISSGIDVWTKRTRAPVIDEWYKRVRYHEDDGDGLDDYEVGRSRGCGGLGVWSDGRLYPSINFRSARIVTTGPIRSEFELTYDEWDAGGRKVAETKRISIDAGSNLSRAVSVFTSGDPSPIQVAVGIAQRPGEGAVEAKDRDAGWMAYWQAPDRDRGSIGCAVVLPQGSIEDFAMETASVPQPPPDKRMVPGVEGLHPAGNLLAIAPAAPNTPFVYYFGAGWSRSGDFQDAAAWAKYVGHFAERLAAPLKVSLSAPEKTQ